MNHARTMIGNIRAGGLALLVLALGLSAHANIDYSLNHAVGAGSVTGTITTDGTLGVLSAGNLVDWDIVIFDGSSSFNLLGPQSGSNSALYFAGSSLSSTLTDLLWDYSNPNYAGLLIQNPHIGSSQNWFALEGPSNGIGGYASSMNLRVGFGPNQVAYHNGVKSVGTANGANVPDGGSTATLLGAVMAGMACLVRRRAA